MEMTKERSWRVEHFPGRVVDENIAVTWSDAEVSWSFNNKKLSLLLNLGSTTERCGLNHEWAALET